MDANPEEIIETSQLEIVDGRLRATELAYSIILKHLPDDIKLKIENELKTELDKLVVAARNQRFPAFATGLQKGIEVVTRHKS